MKLRQTGIGLALVSAVSLALLWLTDLPLGVPGEWKWDRIPFDLREWTVLLLGGISALVVGALYLGLTLFGARRIAAAGRGETAAWLLALFVGGFAWLWAVQESPAQLQYTLAKAPMVLYWRGTEGYFDQARYVMTDVPSYLRTYEERMAEGDVLHLGTHPPGLMLFHRACINLCTASPTLRDLLLRTQPASFRDSLDVIEQTESGSVRAITSADRAALWLVALNSQAAAAATVVPLYLLVRRNHPRPASWCTAALWPLVPALAVFLPKSDALVPFFGALFLWAWLEGFARKSYGLCLLAGFVFFLSMFLSLAILPVAAAAGLLTLWESVACSAEERVPIPFRTTATCLVAALAGWGLPVIAVRVLGHLNLLAVWQWNYRNHAAFYSKYARTYWKWLLVNPLELTFAVGAPLMLAAAIGLWSSLRGGWRQRSMGPYWCLTASGILLWFSGKNLGEAARLWLVLMPWPVWLTAGFFDVASTNRVTTNGPSQITRAALVLFAAQIAVSLGTVTRVTGFDFATLPTGQNPATAKTVSNLGNSPASLAAVNHSHVHRLTLSTR
jgi:methylthioxylose transferase